MEEHAAVLVRIARRLCNNPADADDLVQETYERALRSWSGYHDQGNLRGWLASILNHLFLDRCRKARRTPRVEALDLLELPAPEPDARPTWTEVTLDQVVAALDQLSPPFRQAFELHAAGRSYDQIARELHIAKPTVGTRLVRARRKLRDVLATDREPVS